MHVDSLDLYRDGERRKFIERAAEETSLEQDLLKRDLGKLLLALEQTQEERLAAPADDRPRPSRLSRRGAKPRPSNCSAPRICSSGSPRPSTTRGIVGEAHQPLAAYLACTSRLLATPLAVIIQSTSAAGKTTLMEAVLVVLPGGRAGQILRHDRPEPLLPRRDQPQAQDPRHRRGGGRREGQLRAQAPAERRAN